MILTPLVPLLQYLEENIAAVNVKLTPQDVKDIRQAAKDADAAQGDRYPPGIVGMVEQLLVETPLAALILII